MNNNTDNSYDRGDLNVNKQTAVRRYTEDLTGLMFGNFNDNDDEVFEEYHESSTTTVVITREPRIRRVSDVIDSIGCSPSSPVSAKSGNFDFNEKAVSEIAERSINIVRREDKYIHLMSPPPGMTMNE